MRLARSPWHQLALRTVLALLVVATAAPPGSAAPESSFQDPIDIEPDGGNGKLRFKVYGAAPDEQKQRSAVAGDYASGLENEIREDWSEPVDWVMLALVSDKVCFVDKVRYHVKYDGKKKRLRIKAKKVSGKTRLKAFFSNRGQKEIDTPCDPYGAIDGCTGNGIPQQFSNLPFDDSEFEAKLTHNRKWEAIGGVYLCCKDEAHNCYASCSEAAKEHLDKLPGCY